MDNDKKTVIVKNNNINNNGKAILNNKSFDEDRIIIGRNSVLEAIKSDASVDRLFVLDGCHDGSVETIKREARKRGIITDYVSRERLLNITGQKNNQGVAAYSSQIKYASIDDMISLAKSKNEAPFLMILDHIEDPHNFGAIIRTANQVGVHGIIIPDRRAVQVTPTVLKVSSGAAEHTLIAKVKNLSSTIKDLKNKGLWIVCADMHGTVMYDVDLKGPICLVMGNEGKGVSELVRKECDLTAKIPMVGDIDSLNVSVATAVLSYEIFRQRSNR